MPNIDTSDTKIALIGCGLHARRIYINYLKSRGVEPGLIIDTLKNKASILQLIKESDWANTQTYFVNSSDSYNAFTDDERKGITGLLTSLEIKKAIISTPPEVHIPYAKLCLRAGIKVLLDKPLSAPRDISWGNSEKLLEDLRELLKYDTGDNIIIQCQRRRHEGYRYVKQLIKMVDERYGIQPHFIDIYHSDGRWDFPDEIATLTNHPYATGYGKLLHSGYHFVDLLAFLTDDVSYEGFDVFAYKTSVADFKAQIPDEFYKKIFGIDNTFVFPQAGYGEIDSYSLVQLKNHMGVKTTAAINLLHTGFSRRAWATANADLYKGNGRIRHERVNIQIGPLMNIQVHSYQSAQVHDKQTVDTESSGGLEHFDIHIFRNSELIGGKPYEMIKLSSIEKGNKTGLGQNEYARYQLLDDFLADRKSHSNLKSHIRTNILMASIAKSTFEGKQVSRGLEL